MSQMPFQQEEADCQEEMQQLQFTFELWKEGESLDYSGNVQPWTHYYIVIYSIQLFIKQGTSASTWLKQL